ncbi:Uncharacterised protein [Suttonella ornithocola]|uniref:Uncharacterized protein n=1 Tax=Suttonella ornithocola TaxID=279832 RepID=A0A380MQN9_9GAMM|nr:Uncharacterised protein [Suttonella ornithocola]
MARRPVRPPADWDEMGSTLTRTDSNEIHLVDTSKSEEKTLRRRNNAMAMWKICP